MSKIDDELKGAYRSRPYKMRALGTDGLNIVVSIPKVVIEREARQRGLTIEQFLQQCRAIAYYNSLDGVLYRFEGIQ
ncbi:unnamed protein product [marine sediment metagenome]|uniref:Uncharacterized protein n=1 Tax=marine sediment metagenome TaxID=412755 RepID=X1HX05_9ZZZZ